MHKSHFLVTRDLGAETFLWQTRTRKRLSVPTSFWNRIDSQPILAGAGGELLLEYEVFVDDPEAERAAFMRDLRKKYSEAQREQLLVTIVPSLRCNLACDYCFQKSIRKSEAYRIARWDTLMRERVCDFTEAYMARQGTKLLLLSVYGGEPMLEYNAVVETTAGLERACSNTGARMRKMIVTNGTLLDTERTKNLTDLGFSFYFTVDVGESIGSPHRTYRSGKGSYADANTAAQRCSRIGRTNVNIVCTDDIRDVDEEDVLAWIEGYDVSNVSFTLSPMFSYESGDCNDNLLIEDIGRFLHVHKVLRNAGIEIHCYSDSICPCLHRHKFIIDPLGKVSKCGARVGDDVFVFTDDIAADIKVIDEDNERWLSSIYDEIEKYCVNCPLLPSCMGGCLAENRAIHGSVVPFECDSDERTELMLRLQLADTGRYLS